MTFNINQFIDVLKQYKKGLIVGALVGAGFSMYCISTGLTDLNSIASAGKGLLDNMMNRSSAVDIATWKVYITFTSFGAAAGLLIEMLLHKLNIIK